MTREFSPGQVGQLRRELAGHTHHLLRSLLSLPLHRAQALRAFSQAEALPAITLLLARSLARSLARAGYGPQILQTPTQVFWIEVSPFHLLLCPPDLTPDQLQVEFQQVSPIPCASLLDLQAFTPGDLTFDHPD